MSSPDPSRTPSLALRFGGVGLGLALLHLPLLGLGLTAAGAPLRFLHGDLAVGFGLFAMPSAALLAVGWVAVAALLIGWLDGRITTAVFAGLPLPLTRAVPFVYLAFWGVQAVTTQVGTGELGGLLVFLGTVGGVVGWLALLVADAIAVPVFAALGSMALVRYPDWDGARAARIVAVAVGLSAVGLVASLGLLPCLGNVDRLLASVGLLEPPAEPVPAADGAEFLLLLVPVAIHGVVLTAGAALSRLRLAVPLGLANAGAAIAVTTGFGLFVSRDHPGAWLAMAPPYAIGTLGGFLFGFACGALGFALHWLGSGTPALRPVPDTEI